MKDPHIHVEHDQLMGHAAMRDLLTGATGLASGLPKTVRTGCDKRRPFAMTSQNPASVTCLPCRDYAVHEHQEQARLARDLLPLMREDPASFGGVTVRQLADIESEAIRHEGIVARYLELEAGQ